MKARALMVAPAVLILLILAYLSGWAAWEGLTAIIDVITGGAA